MSRRVSLDRISLAEQRTLPNMDKSPMHFILLLFTFYDVIFFLSSFPLLGRSSVRIAISVRPSVRPSGEGMDHGVVHGVPPHARHRALPRRDPRCVPIGCPRARRRPAAGTVPSPASVRTDSYVRTSAAATDVRSPRFAWSPRGRGATRSDARMPCTHPTDSHSPSPTATPRGVHS